MSRPFDYIDNEKVDLNNQSHRDIVIARNKKLNNCINKGINIQDHKVMKIIITTRVYVTCVVCGKITQKSIHYDYEDVEYLKVCEMELPNVKCSCCKGKYKQRKKDGNFSLTLSKKK